MPQSDFLPPRGRVAQSLIFEIEKELTQQDVIELGNMEPVRSAPPPLQRLRPVHHEIARLKAQGYKDTEIAIQVGRNVQRIRDYETDPTFRELVAYYAAQRTDLELEDGRRIRSKLVELSEVAIDEVQDRLDDPAKREKMSTDVLLRAAQLGLDRTVAPPKQTDKEPTRPVEITFNIAGRGLNPPKIVELKPEESET